MAVVGFYVSSESWRVFLFFLRFFMCSLQGQLRKLRFSCLACQNKKLEQPGSYDSLNVFEDDVSGGVNIQKRLKLSINVL